MLFDPLLTEPGESLIVSLSPEFSSIEYSPSEPGVCTDDDREETVELHLLADLRNELVLSCDSLDV